LSREKPFFDDQFSTIFKARDVRESREVCVKVYRDTGPIAVQRFRRSVELLLTFRGRFNEKGLRVEGSQNLDLLLEELRSQTNLSDYASAHSFLSHMNFRSCFAEIICYSHDKEWMPAMDMETNLLFIVMEIPELSLRDRLNECVHTKSSLKVDEILQIHWALVTMVCGLHTEGFIHLDIKPTTLFRYRNAKGKEVWKLLDLDGAVRTGSQVRLQDLPYVQEYAPPELAQLYLKGQREGGRIKLSRSMNVWTIGMCAMEAVALMPVYDVKFSWYQKWKQNKGGNTNFLASIAGEKSNMGLEKVIPQDLREGMQFVSEDMGRLLEIMLVKEPKHRASIAKCLLHKWFVKKRQQAFNARWGIEDEEDDEEKKKKEAAEEEQEMEIPNEVIPEDLRAYIKAQLAKSVAERSGVPLENEQPEEDEEEDKKGKKGKKAKSPKNSGGGAEVGGEKKARSCAIM